ncbi:hypothetical protein TCAL_06852 [Tigriopus californicus]|uniref:protein-tyrosine-phosphatase n=1 Tax=Tigriopus californicus TaxID=6832 RepID=A0A553NDH2_TIGCA|nr:M-phase inducer phosphatase-like [Tigriopus californicus]TRY63490.1 hypothetical protein TCAL_06852 [Tigriopus californicus]|eukprot:TCALIF_06852-PA protein Name:"Similar to stg M-phase inducer phosphatase (Drosophila melanogaster)" AED:0.02 eAED:0.02 QI:59/1/1/1/1/1/2/506/405
MSTLKDCPMASNGSTPKMVFKKPSALTQLRLLQRPLDFSLNSPMALTGRSPLSTLMETSPASPSFVVPDSPMSVSSPSTPTPLKPLVLNTSPSTPKSSTRGPIMKKQALTASDRGHKKVEGEAAAGAKTNCEGSFLKRRKGMRGEKRSISMEDVEDSPISSKRREYRPTRPGLPVLQRSFSEANAASIRQACERLDEPNTTADRTRTLSLPVMLKGKKHTDLDTIDCHTLARLMRGEFADKVESYRIIDARYTYEFEGGHIRGAENFGAWEEQTFFDEFLPSHLVPLPSGSHQNNKDQDKRQILIFHCEFSSQRGPKLYRELRQRDRIANAESYPCLHYPEVYLLHNGYKEFFYNYKELCEPQAYLEMVHPAYIEQELKFRKKSKSWTGGTGGTTIKKGALTRLF